MPRRRTTVSTTTTTTTTVAAFFRKPPSPLTAAILLILHTEGHSTTVEIAERLGVSPSRVRRILNYWRQKGLVTRNSPTWHLTDIGIKIVGSMIDFLVTLAESYYSSFLNRTNYTTRLNKRTHHTTTVQKTQLRSVHISQLDTRSVQKTQPEGVQTTQLDSTSVQTTKGGQNEAYTRLNQTQQAYASHNEARYAYASIHHTIGDLKLDEGEAAILSALTNLCASGGPGYAYIDQLAELTGMAPDDVLRYSRWLQSRGIVYIYRDRMLGVRIGLRSRWRMRLCSKGASTPGSSGSSRYTSRVGQGQKTHEKTRQ